MRCEGMEKLTAGIVGFTMGCLVLFIIFYKPNPFTDYCLVWHSRDDSYYVECGMVNEERCKAIGCYYSTWSCGAPACLCEDRINVTKLKEVFGWFEPNE